MKTWQHQLNKSFPRILDKRAKNETKMLRHDASHITNRFSVSHDYTKCTDKPTLLKKRATAPSSTKTSKLKNKYAAFTL